MSKPDALVFNRALLQYARDGAKVLGATSLDEHLRYVLIMTVVYTGEAEGRPYTVVDLANYASMSRTTVQRAVALLCRREFLRMERQGRRKVVMLNREHVDTIAEQIGQIMVTLVQQMQSIRLS